MNREHFYYPSNISFRDKEERLFAKERLIFNVTEDLLVYMEENGVTKNELAKRLGKTKAYISQVLDGSRNMTLGTFSDICFALGFKPQILMPVEVLEPSESNSNNTWMDASCENKVGRFFVTTRLGVTTTFDAPSWGNEDKDAA